MLTFDPRAFVRQFRENGLKLLFEDAGNVRDLLALTRRVLRGVPDFARLRVDPTSYVAADYRHLASDVVLRVPYRTRAGGRTRTLTLYILIEHQSEPDAFMVFRVLEYLVQVYKAQARAYQVRHPSLKNFAFQPVLPIVLYTGTRPWDALEPLARLVAGGDEFADVLPAFRPVFLSLPALPAADLETAGGYLGWVLELIQKRDASPEEYRHLATRVVAHLEQMSAGERERWLLLLSYIQALAYHDRVKAEHEEIRSVIVSSAREGHRRDEVDSMSQTMAEYLHEEGHKEGLQEGLREGALQTSRDILVSQLRVKFGRVPRAAEKVVRASEDLEQLHAWLNGLVKADTLDDLGIVAR